MCTMKVGGEKQNFIKSMLSFSNNYKSKIVMGMKLFACPVALSRPVRTVDFVETLRDL